MTKAKETIEQRLLRSMQQAVAIHQGKAPAAKSYTVTARQAKSVPAPKFNKERIAQLRERLGLSQTVFAGAFNVGVSTAQSWEQGLRVPEGPAMRLMQIAEKQPAVILQYVQRSGDKSRGRAVGRAVQSRAVQVSDVADRRTGHDRRVAAKRVR